MKQPTPKKMKADPPLSERERRGVVRSLLAPSISAVEETIYLPPKPREDRMPSKSVMVNCGPSVGLQTGNLIWKPRRRSKAIQCELLKMAEASIECGFCCRQIMDMENPIILPCSHVHCMDCIKNFYEGKKTITCPEQTCGQAVKESLKKLLPYAESSKICDICQKKHKIRKLATCYCENCRNHYCESHKQVHEAGTVDHSVLPLCETNTEPVQQSEDRCKNHEGQILSLGCRTCLVPFCVKCVSWRSTCIQGDPHQLMSLEELVSELVNEEIPKSTAEIEKRLELLFKKTSKTVALHDKETEEGLERLEKARVEHLKVVKEQFDQLEDKWVERRRTQKNELTIFLDNEVVMKWNQLRDQSHQIKSKIKQPQQINVLRSLKEFVTAQKKAFSEGFPYLVAKDSVCLVAKDKGLEIELEIKPAADVIIADGDLKSLPSKEMVHLETLKLPACPLSLYGHDRYLFVGMDNNNIARIDSSYNINKSFISCSAPAESIIVYRNRVYTLSEHDEDYAISVFNMLGDRLNRWSVSVASGYFSDILAIVSDELVVAEQAHRRLAVFSLSGQLVRYVPCSVLGNGSTFMSALDDSSVLISDVNTFQISKFNIYTGAVEWSENVSRHCGICFYKSKYVLVGRAESRQFQILDLLSGSLVSELTSDVIPGDGIYRLQMFGSYLAVANSWYEKISLFAISSHLP
ncbi:uncharacterized protein [Watersipora subatra]